MEQVESHPQRICKNVRNEDVRGEVEDAEKKEDDDREEEEGV